MKMTVTSLASVALLLSASIAVRAQPPSPFGQYDPDYTGHFYIGADAGGVIMQDMNVRNANAKMAFEPGTRGDFFVGYQIAPPFAVEFETGALWNQLRTGNGLYVTSIGQRGDLFQVPFLADAVFRLPLGHGLSAYIGAGAGGVASQLDFRNSFNGFFGFRHRDSDTDVTFAYQGKTGLKYAIAPNMDVDVGYKFLGTMDHTWFEGNAALFTHTDPAYSHSFLASFTLRF